MNDLKEKLTHASEVYNAYANAPIGALGEWNRLMGRNSYTVDPSKPEPDALDTARQAAYEAAVSAYAELMLEYGRVHVSVPRPLELAVDWKIRGEV